MEITVREWIAKFNNGDFDKKDLDTQCNAGWYDWFCSTDALAGRLKKMGKIIKDIKSDYILDNFYVWFKNNCPCAYPLYDDFRFEPLDKNKEDADDKVRDRLYFGVQCDHPFGSECLYEVFTARSGYKTEFKCKNKREVLKVIDQLAEEFQQEEKRISESKKEQENYGKSATDSRN